MFKGIKRGSLVIVCLVILFPLARLLLIVDGKPKETDVIIVLSGDIGRLEKAAELYHKGCADKVVLSNASEAGTTPEEAVALGVLEKDLILEEDATSTYTNATYAKETMIDQSFGSAIVVSSDYHMRRVKLVFDRVYKDSDIELTYVSSLRNDQAWYRDNENIRYTAMEFIKLPSYVLRLYKFVDL